MAPQPASLDAQALMRAALRRAGRTEFSDRDFLEPLQQLLRSYREEARLSGFGLYAAQFDVMRSLDNLLRFDAVEEADPGIRMRSITRPLFITGLPRSSSTFLHTLLAQDPENAVPRCWQLIHPYPARRSILPGDLRKARVALQLRLFRALAPELARLHPLSADMPQECTDITAQVFQSFRFEISHRVPAYRGWLAAHGHDRAFCFHRRFLQHLEAQAPGRRWVLKSPDHVFALDAIRAVYPDAEIVFMHRDPLQVLGSWTRLTDSLRRPFSDCVDRKEVGSYVCSRLIGNIQQMLKAASGPRAGQILHLHYDRVVSQPMETVVALYRHCGRTLSREAEHRMRLWLCGHWHRRRDGYDLAEFGLDVEAMRVHFSHYMDHFGVLAEGRPLREAVLCPAS